MEPTAHMETAQGEIQENRGTNGREEEPSQAEKQFLKELYMFMRRRDTPIERIPNLGFKQIDLYLMYVTVTELGGYQQVTAQQLWKQVYNVLGGNPRSTSAATCTRRHYEKLLLSYECHVKGVLMSFPPQLQPNHFQPAKYGKDEGDGPLALNRRLLPVGLPQNVHPLQSNQYRSAFHQPFPMPHFYHQTHAGPPRVLPPLTPAALQPKFTFEPYARSPVEEAKEPLEHLRYLAERYKSTSGLSEPLNLSVRAPKREAPGGSASSFAPPPSVKNPKFLNKPSPLYCPTVPKVARSERSEAQAEADGEAASSPTRQSTFSPQPGERQSSPKTSGPPPQPRERRAEGPEARGHGFNPLLTAGLPRENQKGEMEIEIPLSVFQKWLRLCKFPEQRRPPDHEREQHSTQGGRSDSEAPQNLTFRVNPPTPEDLSTRRPASGHHHRPHLTGHNLFGSYNSPPLLGFPHGPSSSAGKHPIDQHRDVPRPYGAAKFPDGFDAREQRTSNTDPPKVQQSREACRSYGKDAPQRKEHAETSPPAVLFLNSSGSSPLLQLTSDEVRKLKKIISSSS